MNRSDKWNERGMKKRLLGGYEMSDMIRRNTFVHTRMNHLYEFELSHEAYFVFTPLVTEPMIVVER